MVGALSGPGAGMVTITFQSELEGWKENLNQVSSVSLLVTFEVIYVNYQGTKL